MIDISNPTALVELGAYDHPYQGLSAIGVSNGIAYIGSERDGIIFVDLSDPTMPRTRGSIRLAATSQSWIEPIGTTLYIGDVAGLQIVNAHNPLAPWLVNEVRVGQARNVDLVGTTAYVSADFLYAIDVTQPAFPVIELSYEPAGTLRATEVRGNLAYLATFAGIEIVDLAAAPNGVRIAAHPETSNNIAVRGEIVYSTDDRNLLVIDTSDCPICYSDCDRGSGKGVLDIFDFLCFQDAFVSMDPYADCTGEGTFDIFDFLCFQDAFTTGCP